MQTGHVQQSRHGETIREQPVHAGVCWKPECFISLYLFIFKSPAEQQQQISGPIWQRTKMIQDRQTTKQSTENHRAPSATPNSALWRRFPLGDA